ncbi:polysaccharide deacetylase family protein [Candidatus Neomarinimicrobiota bacterium]
MNRIPCLRFFQALRSSIILFSIPMLVSCSNNTHIHGTYSHGGIIRGDTTVKELALIFTGGDFSDGGSHITSILHKHGMKAGFFFTGDFYRSSRNAGLIRDLISDGHYLGPHSNRHLLYCPWNNRDSLLVTREEFVSDMQANIREMEQFGILPETNPYFIPPFEWYNDSIATWARREGWVLFNHTPGTLSAADYTTPMMPNYRDSDRIWNSVIDFEQHSAAGLNGFILLTHIGTDPERTDKFYYRLEPLLLYLRESGYRLVRIDSLLHKLETSGLSN